MIDAASGEDSLINGILLGGLAGLVFAPTKQSPRTPVAYIVLVFRDGEQLPIVADRAGVTSLVANIKPASCSLSSKTMRPYTETERSDKAAEDAISELRKQSIFIGIFVFIVVLVAMVAFSPTDLSGTDVGYVSNHSHHETLIRVLDVLSSVSDFLFKVLVALVAGFSSGVAFFFMLRASIFGFFLGPNKLHGRDE